MNGRPLAIPLRLLALALALAVVGACNDDSSDTMNPPGGGGTFLLQYDGPQDASPNLTGNVTYEAAARFTSTQTAALMGGTLTQVQFFIQTVPDLCRVKIYGPGTATMPGALLYVQDVTSSVIGGSWNTHDLLSDVTITGGDIWISIEFTDTATQTTIGCDPGPANPNGNWFYDSGVGSWAPFSVSVNWNVRGVVQL